MADRNQIELPEGFELDAPEALALPEGFELDKPRELPEDIELFGQALSESDASRFLADLRSEKIDITRGEEEPILSPSGVVLKGPADIRDTRRREAEDGWAEVIGRSVIQAGLVVPSTIGGASRFLNDALGLDFRGVGPDWLQDIPDLWDLKQEADNFWKPKVGQNEAKRLVGQIVRTMGEMGTAALLTGGSGMLPALSASAGLQKFVEGREGGADFWKAAYGGGTQFAIEYTTEKLPIGILLKPGLSFSRRLMLGLITDVPGELAATAGEMALVDTQILGKRYTLDQYISSLKETAIVAVGVTGGMTVATHPAIAEIEEFEKEVKSDPETFEAQFQQKLNETAGVKEEAPTPEQLEETKQADIETAKKTFTDLGMDEVTATEEATKIAEQVAKAREVFHQEEIREDPVETITADIAGQLQATGRISKEDADLQAEALYGTFFVSMAKRVGADPIDLFESYNVSIGRERAITPGIEGITEPETLFQEGTTPDAIAESLGIRYNGLQEGTNGFPDNHLFTDNVTGTTFGVENLDDVEKRLQEKRVEFGVTTPPAPVFFSQLERVAEEKIPEKIPAGDAFNILKKNTKAEELKWSGVEDFLKDKKSVTKDELLEFLRANEITVTETQKGGEGAPSTTVDTTGWTATASEFVEGDWEVFDAQGNSVAVIAGDNIEDAIDGAARNVASDLFEGATKFEDQTLPGGEDYTELVLTLPPLGKPKEKWKVVEGGIGFKLTVDGILSNANEWKTREEAQRVADSHNIVEQEAEQRITDFTGGHFDEPNVLAHIRFNTRTDAEGNKVLFLEEIQSDWAAKGRKEGFKRELTEAEATRRKELQAEITETVEERDDARAKALETGERQDIESFTKRLDELTAELDELRFIDTGIPSAPLLKKWPELALKRMLRYAAENDFDKLAWITGEQTADRYDLSKQVSEIEYSRNEDLTFNIEVLNLEGNIIFTKTAIDHSELESVVGKDITNKMESGEGTKRRNQTVLSGDGLKVGGAWAINLYDKVIPNFLKKYGKKWGVKVEDANLGLGEDLTAIQVLDEQGEAVDEFKITQRDQAEEFARTIGGTIKDIFALGVGDQQSIDITQEMKASVLAGQPLFQKKKGRIEFGPEGVKIDLLRDADPSTLLHETGHFYLKVLGDLAQTELADQELIDDAQIVADWVGAPDLSVLTRDQSEQFARGFEAYLREGKAPSSALRKAFVQFKEWLTEVYQRLKALNVELTPEVRGVMDRMLASQEEIEAVQTEIDEATIDLVAEGRDLNKITQAEIKKHLTPAARRTVKGLILETVGKRQAHKFIREDKALSASWKKAEQSARKAFKAGKLEEATKWKLKMKEVIAKANAKVEVIQTEKQKMAKRRRTLSVIKNFLNLTDAQMKGLTKKRNVANMTDWEFKQFKDDLLIRAEQVQETVLAKARVMEIIERKQLKKVENYQKSLGLPTIHKMSAKQLNEFVELLEVFEDADVFLNTRELETVDRTDLRGIRTWREAKERLAKETGASIEDLNAIKVNWTDKFKWDNALAESNPFYELIVTEMNKKLLQAEARVHEVENEIFRLSKASEKSRGRSITRKLIPQDKQVMAYLEASEDVKPSIAKEMTPEQLDLAHFMGQYFNSALEYLIKTKSLDKGRENYFVHIRRSFLETLKDDGLGSAIMNVFKDYQEQEMVFNILDGDTGNILPLEKFFQFSLRRTGALTPTQNVVKAFLAYSRTFEKKVTLDEAIPKLDIYAQSLTPQKLTSRGLELDRSLKKFVYQFVNNKKGRQIDLSFVKQGDKVDLSIRALRTFITLLDLGLSIPVGIASFVGEQAANFTMLGEKGFILGTTRGKTKKGKAILKKYEAFVGRSAWEEFFLPGKEIGERVMEGMFGFFHQATVTANKQFLLASLSKSEYDSGTISDERLAQLRIEMGRFRAIPGAKSLIGSTSPGGAANQYRSWAIPILRTVTKDIGILATDLKNKPTGEALTTREARELFRAIRLSFIAVLVLGFGDREDKTFIGQLSYKARREVLTILQALSPILWTSTPRMVGFVTQLGKNIQSIIMLEEYKTKPGLKGVGGIKRQFTPSVVRQLTPDEERRQRR